MKLGILKRKRKGIAMKKILFCNVNPYAGALKNPVGKSGRRQGGKEN
jgi:hypothetical protein